MRRNYFVCGRRTLRPLGRAAILAVLSVLLVSQTGIPALAEDANPADPAAEQPPDSAAITIKLTGGLSPADQATVIERNGGTETSSIAPLRLHTITFPADDVDEAVARYLADPQVESAEVDRAREVEGSPSDPGYGDQWALPQIGWPEAYGSVEPTGTATIAVLDTGVDASDPDLAGVVVGGYSTLEGVSPTSDPNGHGTAMATIAAAATDNAVGTAGVAYAGTSVMPVTVLDADGIGWDSDIIEGVVWAADHGADVILMSFSNPGYSEHLQEAVDYAWSKGVVLVAATGNDGSAEVTYPAGTAKVVGVAATDSADELWSGSNHGAAAFIAAPGVDIANGSGSTTGTSASAAIVAGAAAMVQANDPAASNGAVVGRLARNADAAGTTDQTGNGRVNLARALADVSDEEVVPVGAVSGEGGPLVGPYVAAATTNSATLNGGSTVSVAPSASVTAAVNVTSGNGNGNRAGSIGWRVSTSAPGSVTCVNIADHNSTTRTDTFPITAPASSGTYNAYFIAYSDDLCTSQPSNTLALAGGVIVQNNNPVPTLTSISPTTKSYGDAGFTLTVTGTNFISSSVVRVDGSPRTTTFVTGTSLTAAIPASDLLSVGTRSITVFNPTPGGGTSGSVLLTVTQRTVSPSFTAANKVYDGGTAATITGRSLTGAVAGDDVSLAGGSAAFLNKNVGTGKTVNASGFTLAGTKASNYVLSSSSASATADITARPLTVTATGVNRAYNGTTNATVTLSDDRVSGDAVTTAYASASFLNKNVGTGKTVNVSGISITGGADAGNYSLANTAAATTANIAIKSVSGSFVADNKVYDGTTAAAVTSRSLLGVLEDDSVSLTGGTATFATKHVGTGKTVTLTGAGLSGVDAGNYTLTGVATTTANVEVREITVSAVTDSKAYDGTVSSDEVPAVTSGTIAAGDTAGFTQSFDTKNVGTGKTLTATGAVADGNDGDNYDVTFQADSTGEITAIGVSGSFVADNKVYDGTTAAAVTSRSLLGVLEDDSVSLTGGTATFATKHVGTGKTVTLTGAGLSGVDAGNYTLTGVATTTANVEVREITVSAVTDSKAYDGTVSSDEVPAVTSGTIAAGDTAGFTQSFDTKNVGTGKTLTATGAVADGNDGDNYDVTFQADSTGEITAIGVSGSFVADNKVYDGTTAAAVTSRSLLGVLEDDSVSLTGGTATFATKHVGTGKTVTLTGAGLSGVDAGNYTLTGVATTTANVEVREITVSAVTDSKAYDGTVSSDEVPAVTSGTIAAGDTAGFTQSFDTKNVGTGKTLTATGAVADGNDGDNYDVTFQADSTGEITAIGVSGSFVADNKVYDGTTAAAVTSRSLLGVLEDDSVSLTGGTATFATKHVGTGKTVTLTGAGLSGVDAGNYTLTGVATTTANVEVREITVSAVTDSKAYDGTVSSDEVPAVTSGTIPAGDTAGFTQSFDTKNVGTGKTLTATGAVADGNDGDNYDVTFQADSTGEITAIGVSGSFVADNKVYDGTTAAAVTSRSLLGVLEDDSVSLTGGTATFATKHVGTGKTVTLTGAGLSGVDAGNYTLTGVATTTANVEVREITVSAVTDSKAYDGTVSSDEVPAVTSGTIAAGDTAGFTQSFDTKNVGTGKTLTATGAVADGNDGDNYDVTFQADSTGEITAIGVSGSFVADNKVYDGTTAAAVTSRSLLGVLEDDSVSLTGGTATFATKHVGTGKTVTLTGAGLSGVDAGNYTLTGVATTTANVEVREITVSAVTDSKAYDGTVSSDEVPAVTSGTIAAGDTAGFTQSFDTKNVGTGKTLTATGAVADGNDGDNYDVTFQADSTGEITAIGVSGSFVADNKVYDGTTAAAVTSRSLLGVLEDDSVSLTGGTATFATKHVGTGKTVTLTGAGLSGVDAGNYTLTGVATTTANVEVREITVSAVTDSKAYDGTVSSDEVPAVTSGTIAAGDTAGFTQSFDTKNVGTGKTLTATGAVADGNDGDNYDVTFQADSTGEITAIGVSGSFVADNKVYDGTTAAAVTSRSLLGVLEDDSVSLTGGTATFATKHVGTGKTVTLTGAGLSGVDAGNYTLTGVATTTANVEVREITVSAVTDSKAYDGTVSSDEVPAVTSGTIAAGDTAGFTQSFDTKNVGTGKTLTATGAVADGNDGDNYDVTFQADSTGEITAIGVSGSFVADNKVYDGTTAAAVTSRSLLGVLEDDSVSLTGGTATFATKHVGTGKTVTLTGAGLSGVDAGNYTLTGVATTTANVTPKPLSVTAANKSMTSGGPGPTLTATFGTFAAGDGPADLGGPLVLKVFDGTTEIVPGPATPAGTYDIRPSGLTSTNYAITFVDGLLTVGLRIEGFYSPVDMTPYGATRKYNSVKGGSTVPLKFRVYSGLREVTDPAGMTASWRSVNCESGVIDPELLEAVSTSAAGLRYSGQFIFNWAVPKAAGKCYQVTIVATDGTELEGAFFRSK